MRILSFIQLFVFVYCWQFSDGASSAPRGFAAAAAAPAATAAAPTAVIAAAAGDDDEWD